MTWHMFEYCLTVFHMSAKNKTLFLLQGSTLYYSWNKKPCQWPQVVCMCFFLDTKSRPCTFWGLSDPNRQKFILISSHRAVVSCSFADMCYVILGITGELSYLHFIEIPCSSTLLKIITKTSRTVGTSPPEFQQASCDKMTALQICFVTDGSFHPPFLAMGPFCATPHALSPTTERLWFFFDY